jgi:hypothetical protein
MAKERLYDAIQSAYMARISTSTFRAKVSRLGIKGQRDGAKMYYTRAQIQDVYDGRASKTSKANAAKRAKAEKSTVRRIERKERGKR